MVFDSIEILLVLEESDEHDEDRPWSLAWVKDEEKSPRDCIWKLGDDELEMDENAELGCSRWWKALRMIGETDIFDASLVGSTGWQFPMYLYILNGNNRRCRISTISWQAM